MPHDGWHRRAGLQSAPVIAAAALVAFWQPRPLLPHSIPTTAFADPFVANKSGKVPRDIRVPFVRCGDV